MTDSSSSWGIVGGHSRLRAERSAGPALIRGRNVALGVRSEDMEDAALTSSPAERRIKGKITLTKLPGSEVVVHFTFPGEKVVTQDTKLIEKEIGGGEIHVGADDGVVWVASFAPARERGSGTRWRSPSTLSGPTTSTRTRRMPSGPEGKGSPSAVIDSAAPIGTVHHDGSELYVPSGTPQLGDRVPVRIRVPGASGVSSVMVRCSRTPNRVGCTRFRTGRTRSRSRLTLADRFFVAEIPVHNPVTSVSADGAARRLPEH